jgi:transketolase
METDQLAINTIRILSVDAINKARSGHSGAPLGLAPAGHILWSRFLDFEPNWLNRDRFILSCGHASALYYSLLHIFSHGKLLTMDEIKNFRQLGSRTAGHPEHNLIPEVEATTGCLGQGLANAVGLAAATVHLAAIFNKPDFPIFTNKTYCICSDGDIMEGLSYEVCSWAGTQKLSNLIVLWDNNHITIAGETELTFNEDVPARFRSQGWNVIVVDNADTDIPAIVAAIEAAQKETEKPTFISLRTTIGFGSPIPNSPKVHGTFLTDEQLYQTKINLGFNPEQFFYVPESVYALYDEVVARIHTKVVAWEKLYKEYAVKYPEDYAKLQQVINGDFKYEDFKQFLPVTGDKGQATRVHSGVALNLIAQRAPGLIGGSADLTPSNNVYIKGDPMFCPEHREGRLIEFGIREHAMQGIANGFQFYGMKGLIPYTATFFVFVQYLIPSLRIAAIEHLKELLILTHDSIGLGEDGATHQNVENFSLVRAMPNVQLMRPADLVEVSACYAAFFCGPSFPTILALSRQGTPPVPGTSYDGTLKGGYILKEADSKPDLVMIGTGTELILTLKAAEILEKEGKKVQVVSMPCLEIFDTQDFEYRRKILPANIPILSVEAQIQYGWEKYSHMHCGVNEYGKSAPSQKVYEYFGLVPEKIADKARTLLDFYKSRPIPELLERP